jgi:hypothetical protein
MISSVSDITSGRLTGLLGRGVRVLGVEDAHSAPHLGSVWRVQVEFESPSSFPVTHVIVKSGPSSGKQGKEAEIFAEKNALGDRESVFYRHLLPNQWHGPSSLLPRVYFCSDPSTTSSDQITLVMEDLTKRCAGCECGVMGEKTSSERAHGVMRALGKLHGGFAGMQFPDEEGDRIWTIDGTGVRAFVVDDLETACGKVLEHGLVPEEHCEFIRSLPTSFPAFLKKARIGCPSIAMGDPRMDNMFFREDGEVEALVDMQFCMCGGPMAWCTDLASFLFLNMSFEERVEEAGGVAALIKSYHSSLRSTLMANPMVQMHGSGSGDCDYNSIMSMGGEEFVEMVLNAVVWPLVLIVESGARGLEGDGEFAKEALRIFEIGFERVMSFRKDRCTLTP